jgi:hypothetical protein
MYKEIGVLAAFNSNGDIKPMYIELELDNEKKPIKIDYFTAHEHNYAGTPSIEFDCKLENKTEVTLIYFVHSHIWKIKSHGQ